MPPAAYDGWEMDEQLRHIERVLTGGAARSDPPDADAWKGPKRTDAAHAGAPAWHMPSARRPSRRTDEIVPARRRPPVLLTGTIALLGAGAFGVGIGLLAWSYALGRQELAPLGTPSPWADRSFSSSD